jgi:hypothetical protein
MREPLAAMSASTRPSLKIVLNLASLTKPR